MSFLRFPTAARLLLATAFAWFAAACTGPDAGTIEILNVSYDPTRALYEEFNAFAEQRLADELGQPVVVQMSHGGSGRQARAVIDGLPADVVSFGVPSDIDALVEHGGLVNADWAERLPNQAAPYTSTIVFVVRQGNPAGVRDWADLIQGDIEVVAPNPRTSGGARWVYLAAWGWALRQPDGSETLARDFVAELYRHIPVLDSGARGSSTTFARNGIGDVLITWENEAWLLQQEMPELNLEIVVPPTSILAEPPVSVVDHNVTTHGNREAAERYVALLYSPEAQAMAARHHYRPRDPAVMAQFADRFPAVERFTVEEIAGDWHTVQQTHFNEGGIFDQIYLSGEDAR
jgi:sulfate/thiosulfate-binding protein